MKALPTNLAQTSHYSRRLQVVKQMAKCSDCGFLSTPGMMEPMEVKITGFPPRAEPSLGRLCYRSVARFDYTVVDYDWECNEFVEYEPNHSPREHFQIRESRRAAERSRRTILWVGIGTIVAVVLMGLLSAAVAHFN